MTRARTVLPTDLVALVSFDGRVYPNEAKTWDRLGAEGDSGGPHPLGTAIEQWFSFATGKHAWVSVRGATIRGLVSARKRSKPSAWEVDCLIDADEDKSVCLSLVERMTKGVAREGAERIFVRLAADSPVFEVIRQAGFFPYGRERLYRRDEPAEAETPDLPPLRPRTKEDLVGLYQLYNSVTPANVRGIEGVTLREWQAALEPWGGRPADVVLEDSDSIAAWLRVLADGHKGRFSLLVHPGRLRDTGSLLQAALARLPGRRPLLCLIPEYEEALATPLKRWGFAPCDEYVMMAKRVLKPVEELAPERVGTAVPVS
ncbi:MAG: hypothetical protein HYS09_04415 [Chloroflexi bacterium]|nr:hypothetical protein [Chloroflexota bacterium]